MNANESGIRVASAPVSFGVDEVIADDAWMPLPEDVLRWMASLDYAGTEMGPPGYLGDGRAVRQHLIDAGLEMVGAFLPLHFSRDERIQDDMAWLDTNLRQLTDATPPGSQPFAVLSEAIDEPVRLAYTGRTESNADALLTDARWDSLVANLHAAARLCRERGIEPVIHPHAGTYLETAAEIERMMEMIDPTIVGLCLDTGHFRYGGADPLQATRDYASSIRHVHLKDTRMRILEEVAAAGGGLEQAVRQGVFCPLGEGDADVDGVVAALGDVGYSGWIVIEQDQLLGPEVTGEALVEGQRANREYLRRLGL